MIDQTYRSLFVNTLGFFNTISALVHKHADCIKLQQDFESRHQTKGSLISSIWRVYQILMEFSYSTDYKAQIMTIIDESRKVLRDKEKVFDELLRVEEKKQQGFRD
jgi:hypothetical protein